MSNTDKHRLIVRALALAVAVGLSTSAGASTHAQVKEPPRTSATAGTLNAPGYLPFSDDLLQTLRAPAGFAVSVFAQPQGNARIMAVNGNGDVYLTRQTEGDVLLLRDTDGDGAAGRRRQQRRYFWQPGQ